MLPRIHSICYNIMYNGNTCYRNHRHMIENTRYYIRCYLMLQILYHALFIHKEVFFNCRNILTISWILFNCQNILNCQTIHANCRNILATGRAARQFWQSKKLIDNSECLTVAGYFLELFEHLTVGG